MALSTYAGLQASIRAWLMDRDDLAAVIPDFIALAEADMNNRLRLQGMLKTTVLSAAGDVLPSDLVQVKSVGLSGAENLSFCTPAEAAAYSLAYAGGAAEQWTVAGDSLVIAPAQASGTVTLTYYAAIPALSDDNPTNFVLTRAPGCYLYGALLQAAPYLLEDGRLQTWGPLYDQACNTFQAADDRAEFPGPLVIRGAAW